MDFFNLINVGGTSLLCLEFSFPFLARRTGVIFCALNTRKLK